MEEDNIKDFRTNIADFANVVKQELKADEEMKEKFKDPVILGTILYRLLEERENTNRILKNLLQKIGDLEERLGERELRTEEKPSMQQELELLPGQDLKIIEIIKKMGKVCAAEVKVSMGYKGENAASARLNRLYSMGILKKANVGKKVYFMLSSP